MSSDATSDLIEAQEFASTLRNIDYEIKMDRRMFKVLIKQNEIMNNILVHADSRSHSIFDNKASEDLDESYWHKFIDDWNENPRKFLKEKSSINTLYSVIDFFAGALLRDLNEEIYDITSSVSALS